MRKVANEYNRTPEAIAKQKQLNTPLASMTADEFAVPIPTIHASRGGHVQGRGACVWGAEGAKGAGGWSRPRQLAPGHKKRT